MRNLLRRGYSFAELLVSFFILSVALLGTTAALHYGMTASRHGGLYTEGSNHARSLMQIMLSENRAFSSSALPLTTSGYNDATGVTRPLNDPPFGLADYRLGGVARFRRHIEVREYRRSSDPAAAAWKSDVRQVSVTVSWDESGRRHQLTLVSFNRRPR